MLYYTRIQQFIVPYSEAPTALETDCQGKNFRNGDLLHSIKAGDSWVNTHIFCHSGRNDEEYGYTFREICVRLQPDTVYRLAFCLALYNSQNKSEEALLQILEGHKNESAPAEFADLLRETCGWLFWEHQFTAILRLFTLDRDEPHRLLVQYKRRGCFDKPVSSSWKIRGTPLLDLMEANMLDKKNIYRLLLKPAWVIYNELSKEGVIR